MKKNTYARRRSQRPYKMRPQAKSVIARGATLLIILCVLTAWGRWFRNETPALAPDAGTACLQYVSIPDSVPQEITEYTGFIVSFNSEFHIPNYSAWELTGVEADGALPRKSKFFQDNNVEGCPSLDDYRNSGFDRGHMAPAADMKWSEEAMADSHSLANICPQDHSVNGGVWSTLEKKCRNWAKRDSAIVIICGPVMSDVMPQSIGASGVKVPRRFFKVVLAPFVNPPRAIGFIVPNYASPLSLDEMACTVDDVEAITGYDFFQCLPDSIENEIESKANIRIWNKAKR